MRQSDNQDKNAVAGSLRSTLMLLAFGLGVLGFLVSIDHPEWFHMRPMTGTAVAMSHASDNAMDNMAAHR